MYPRTRHNGPNYYTYHWPALLASSFGSPHKRDNTERLGEDLGRFSTKQSTDPSVHHSSIRPIQPSILTKHAKKPWDKFKGNIPNHTHNYNKLDKVEETPTSEATRNRFMYSLDVRRQQRTEVERGKSIRSLPPSEFLLRLLGSLCPSIPLSKTRTLGARRLRANSTVHIRSWLLLLHPPSKQGLVYKNLVLLYCSGLTIARQGRSQTVLHSRRGVVASEQSRDNTQESFSRQAKIQKKQNTVALSMDA